MVAGAKSFSMGGWLLTNGGDYRRDGLLFMGLGDPRKPGRTKNFSLRVRQGRALEVVSDGRKDVLGTRAAKDTLPDQQWVHLLYSFENGEPAPFI